MANFGYARVSKEEQNEALQLDAFDKYGCQRIYTDKISGKIDRRPEFDKLLAHIEEGDTLVVWRLDRLGRSLKHLIRTVEDLGDRGVSFHSITEDFDTSTANGELVFHIFGALAQFERQLISQRTKAGLASARDRNRFGGRPPALSENQIELLNRMVRENDKTVKEIGDVFGISRATVYRYVQSDDEDQAA